MSTKIRARNPLNLNIYLTEIDFELDAGFVSLDSITMKMTKHNSHLGVRKKTRINATTKLT